MYLPVLQLVLGGHDHHYEITPSRPHGTLVFKSGTDFREFSIIRLQLPPTPQGEAASLVMFFLTNACWRCSWGFFAAVQ